MQHRTRMREGGTAMLRVVAVASRTGRYGGPFDTASRQVRALRAAGMPARLLAGTFDGDRPDRSKLEPGRYVRIRNAFGARGFVTTVSMRMLIAVVQEVARAQTVHISFAREVIPVWTALVALVFRRRLILQPHGMLTARSSRLHRLVDRLLILPIFRRSTAVIALAEAERQQLESWNHGPLPPTQILGNPLPPSVVAAKRPRALPAPKDARIVFIARLHPRKRVGDFVAAAAAARAEGRPWQWVIVGPDDGDGPAVRRAVEANPDLHYSGPVSAEAVVDELNRTTVFVMPSEREPWGNVLASAVAMGIPSVVAKSAALAPAIDAHHAGRTVPDHDPFALLEAVKELLREDCYRAASEGAIALRRDRIGPERLIGDLITLYSALLGRGLP